jgi:pimeloyl-ACP methyl ester carboxylesterase
MIADRSKDYELQLLATEKFPVWEANGAEGRLLEEAVARTGGPLFWPDERNGWASVFLRMGDQLMDRARSPARSGDERASLYETAILYFGIARLPATETPVKREAYGRQKAAFSEARDVFPFDVRQELIPLGDKDIVGNYYEPRQEKEITRPEAVLLTGGADVTKEDMHFIASRIVRDGMACLAIDMPGTGESEWKLQPPGVSAVYPRAIKYLAGRGDDPNRIGMMGTGFGGYWSLACAATCPELSAVVNCGGPVHRAFSHESLKKLPAYYRLALSSAMGHDPADFEKAIGLLGDYSLLRTVDLRRIAVPVLSINGTDDPIVPIEDLFIVAEEGGVRQEEWEFRGDSHCAPRHYGEWMPRAVDWMANKIGGQERVPRPDLAKL